MYRKKCLLLFGSLVVYMAIVLFFVYKSSQDSKRNNLLPISKVKHSSVKIENYNTPVRMVIKIC